jgi:hypothetical protein
LYTREVWETRHAAVVIDVTVRTLDSVLPADETIDFIKIDVEDAEVALLRGAAKTLARCRPVLVIECHVEHAPEVADLLEHAGLRLALIDDFLAGRRRRPDEVLELAVERGEFYFVGAPA